MSYSELKAFDKDGNVVCLSEFRNSHYIIVIWNELAKKYGIVDELMQKAAKERGVDLDHASSQETDMIYYQARGELMQNMGPVWDLRLNPDVSDDDWYCLMFTFDNIVVPPDLIERVAEAFLKFRVSEDVVDHGGGFASCMRKAAKDIGGIRGIALNSTSVGPDPWGGVRLPLDACSECGGRVTIDEGGAECRNADCDATWLEPEYRPYNLDLDDKHYFLRAREEWNEDT
jgi:hypothetical protein